VADLDTVLTAISLFNGERATFDSGQSRNLWGIHVRRFELMEVLGLYSWSWSLRQWQSSSSRRLYASSTSINQ